MPYARHLLCLRPTQAFTKPLEVGDSVPEIVLVNGHDGLTSYNVSMGIYRMVCANGMMIGDTLGETLHVVHRGDILEQVLEATEEMWKLFPKVVEWIKTAQNTTMEQRDQSKYAKEAMAIRYGDSTPFEPTRLLEARRVEDQGDNVWHIYNRVQENLMTGGIEGRSATGRRVTSRPIARVTRDVQYNRELWDLTTDYLEAA